MFCRDIEHFINRSTVFVHTICVAFLRGFVDETIQFICVIAGVGTKRENVITSRVSGRGNIFGSVRVCVLPCVRLRSTGRTIGPTDLKFTTRIKDT